MPRPLKYLEGPVITSVEQFANEIRAGRYIIAAYTLKRVHPRWASNWRFRDVLNGVRNGAFRLAIPNPEHPDNKENHQ